MPPCAAEGHVRDYMQPLGGAPRHRLGFSRQQRRKGGGGLVVCLPTCLRASAVLRLRQMCAFVRFARQAALRATDGLAANANKERSNVAANDNTVSPWPTC